MDNSNDHVANWPLARMGLARVGNIIMGPALAIFFVLGTVVITIINLVHRHGMAYDSTLEIILLGLLGIFGALTLLLRRSYPGQVLAVVLAVTIIEHTVSPAEIKSIYPLPLFFALGGYAALRSWRKVLTVSVISVAVIATTAFLRNDHAAHYGLYTLLGAISFVVPVSSFGLWIGTNRAYVKELQERSMRLERERELLAARAVADERVRIARDLHDVVAHHVSLMVVQAGAIRESLPRDSKLRGPLDVIADTGREAMSEMRRMLGVLREDDLGTIPLSPVPSTTDIAGIVTRANETGLAMSFRIVGTAITLSEAQETCLFRVVQEALTNVVKHTSGARGFVELSYSDEAVTVVIEDLGEPVPTTSEPGHGIEGMRERMSLFGGTLETRAVGAAGFRVVARLPLVGARVQG